MIIGVVGLGKLGLPLAVVAASAGHQVKGVDTDANTVKLANAGIAPYIEPGLKDMLVLHRKQVSASMDYGTLADCDLIFYVVPTPSEPDGSFSLEYLRASLGQAVRKAPLAEHVVVSTVLPGDMRKLAMGVPIATLSYNPQFIALGRVILDLVRPDFVLIGSDDGDFPSALVRFWGSILEKPRFQAMRWEEAEFAKIALNTFLTMKISFANMLGLACSHLDADVDIVTQAIGMDRRIGPALLKAGAPYGGPCLPRDNAALASVMKRLGVKTFLPAAVDALNVEITEHILAAVLNNTLPGQTVALLGLSYKLGTDNTEESLASHLAVRLRERQRQVGELTQSDAVVLCLPDKAYLGIDFGDKIVIDPWRVLRENPPKRWIPLGLSKELVHA